MHRPRQAILIAAAALTAGGFIPPASSAAATPTPPAPAARTAFDLAPGMLAAMRRDLHLTDDQIAARLATEAAAPVIEKRLRVRLGAAFAGAWIPAGNSRLRVAVTTAA